MDLLSTLDEPTKYTIQCKDNVTVPKCERELLKQSLLLAHIFEHDQETTIIPLPLVESDMFHLIYQFWTMNQGSNQYRPVPNIYFEVSDLETLVTPPYHKWANNLTLHQLTGLLCTSNYLQDDNLVNLSAAYINVKLRCYTFKQIKEELNITVLPSKEDVQKLKNQCLPPPPSKSKRKATTSKTPKTNKKAKTTKKIASQ